MTHRKKLGDRGEAIAAAYLQKKKYRLLEHQYRYRRGDIDLICHDPSDERSVDGALVFVEVKTRKTFRFGRPEEAVTAEKQRRILRVAEGYLHEHGLEDVPCRFDVVAVALTTDNAPQVKHFKDAFWAS
jgi:putative endonuclease